MKVTIVEVGPRDGLQNESATVSTADKVAFVDRLVGAGLPVIEVSAFVSPKWVPQMADAADVCAGITRRPGVRYTALVPNLAGLERAHAAGVDEVAIFAAASETFSRKNINQSIDASLVTYRAVCARAASSVCACARYVSTAFGCPFEGHVAPDRVAAVCGAHRDGRVRGRGQRHHRHRASRAGADRVSTRSPSACRSPTSRCTSTTRAARRSPTSWRRSNWASRRSTRRPAGSAAVRMRPARPATSPPKIWSTCSTVWASRPA